jgi:hypothetical protein
MIWIPSWHNMEKFGKSVGALSQQVMKQQEAAFCCRENGWVGWSENVYKAEVAMLEAVVSSESRKIGHNKQEVKNNYNGGISRVHYSLLLPKEGQINLDVVQVGQVFWCPEIYVWAAMLMESTLLDWAMNVTAVHICSSPSKASPKGSVLSVISWCVMEWRQWSVELVKHHVMLNAKDRCLYHVCQWVTSLPALEAPWESLLISLLQPPWSHPWWFFASMKWSVMAWMTLASTSCQGVRKMSKYWRVDFFMERKFQTCHG